MDHERYQHFMSIAMREAEEAFELGEVPVGAVVVFEDKVIGRGYNRTAQLHDASAHAEMIALSAAYNRFGDWRLETCRRGHRDHGVGIWSGGDGHRVGQHADCGWGRRHRGRIRRSPTDRQFRVGCLRRRRSVSSTPVSSYRCARDRASTEDHAL